MLSQVALGLDPAHAKKLVHRDLKPDNLFLCQTTVGDIVKLLDFGSVKDKTSTAKKLTVMGTTIGSPYYMAPEQAQGLDTLDHRADVWALGAIAFECVAGTVPFKGVNGPSILLEILTKEPLAPSAAAESPKYPIPPGMDRAILASLKKTASLRTPSVGALADQVGQAYGLEGGHAQWATTAEEQLDAQITAKLPALMAAPPEAPKKRDAADAFFGDDDSLGAQMDGAFAGAAAAPVPSAQAATLPMRAVDDTVDMVIPVGGGGAARLGWWLVPVVVVIAVLAGVMIAWLI
jgi:serine/threonine-protein kinase